MAALIIDQIKKTREYLYYLEDHVLNVEKAWRLLQEKCKDMRFIYDDYVYFSIQDEIERHDLSKMSEAEFIQFRKRFFPSQYDGLNDFESAWEHHKKENTHHWETWTTIKPTDIYFEEVSCVHMLCDWIAMGFKYGDTAKVYYEKNKDTIKLPDWAVGFIYEIFDRIYGE